MTLYEFLNQFQHALAGCLFVVAIVAGFGLGIAMDTTALTSGGRRTKAGAAADLVVLGGEGIAAH